jgi:hypothetical protein
VPWQHWKDSFLLTPLFLIFAVAQSYFGSAPFRYTSQRTKDAVCETTASVSFDKWLLTRRADSLCQALGQIRRLMVSHGASI